MMVKIKNISFFTSMFSTNRVSSVNDSPLSWLW